MPTTTRRARPRGTPWACALITLSAAVLYASIVQAACGCFGCSSGGSCLYYSGYSQTGAGDAGVGENGDEQVPFAEFQIRNRLTYTATDFTNNVRGDTATMTWGLVDDGTLIASNGFQESNLIAFMNSLYGASPTGDVADAPWFRFFESSFERWESISGLSFNHEPNDGGLPIDGTAAPIGVLGFYPDVRIGGRSIDGSTGSNTLAFNYFPNHSDMVIDTDNGSFFNNRTNDSRLLRNTIMHEIGHGIGLSHLESNSSSQLMEPFITGSIDGPQIDDILAAQRLYGDPLEKDGGNDEVLTATDIGLVTADLEWEIGTDGKTFTVSQDQTDFISIDGSSDVDYFKFSIDEPMILDLSLTQVGRAYNEGPQNGDQSLLDSSVLNDLSLELQISDGLFTIPVAQGTDMLGLPGEEILGLELTPIFDYFIRIEGAEDNVQLYELGLRLTAPIPEPSAGLLLVACLAAAGLGRRSA